MPKITISYRRADSQAMTGRIFDRLIARYGREAIFRDIDNIPAGIDFRQHINETLLKTGVLLAIVGPKWLGTARGGVERINEESDPVRVEVETALRRRLPIIPVLIGNTRMPGSDQLPPSLKDFAFRNAITIDAGRDFDHHMDRLFNSIDAILGEVAKPAMTRREATTPSTAAAPAGGTDASPATGSPDPPRKATSRAEPAGVVAALKTIPPPGKAAGPGRPIVVREWDQIIWPKSPQGRRLRLAGIALVAVALLATLATAFWPGAADVDDVRSLFALQNAAPVSALAFSSDAKTLAAASHDRSVSLWDVAAARLSAKLPSAAPVSSVAFMPNGEQIVSGELNGVVFITAAAGARTIRAFRPDVNYPWEHAPAVQSIAISPDGTRIASGYDEGSIKLWKFDGDALKPVKAHEGAVTALTYLPDGGKLVSAGMDGAVRIWNAATGQRLASLTAHAGAILALAASHDGKWIAAGGSGATVVVWNAATGAVAHRLSARFSEVQSVAFSKAGGRLAVGGNDGTIEWWNVATGQRLATVSGHVRNVQTLAFSPDGKRFASGGDSTTIDIWSTD
jgi:WD40 repeat protein